MSDAMAVFLVPPPIDDPPHPVGVCDICGEEIWEGDRYYHLPDGTILCDEIECLEEWARDYRRI